MTAAPTVTDFAREAWALLARADDPMPPMAALDWLRERLETDDVAAVKAALYGAAADYLLETDTRGFGFSASEIARKLRRSKFQSVRGTVSHCRHILKSRPIAPDYEGRVRAMWLAFCDRADAALALCRQIEAL